MHVDKKEAETKDEITSKIKELFQPVIDFFKGKEEEQKEEEPQANGKKKSFGCAQRNRESPCRNGIL